jgi:hypothetical protein
LDVCSQRNNDLYKVNTEVLDRYEHEGAFGHMARAEPFTRLKRTQIENLVDEYRQRAEELELRQSKGSAVATAPQPTPPTSGAAAPH